MQLVPERELSRLNKVMPVPILKQYLEPIKPMGDHIDDPSGGGTEDAEARTAIESILDALEKYNLLRTQ